MSKIDLEEYEVRNAVIESVSLSDADRGLLSSYLHLSYGDSSGQGFGGYALYLPRSFDHHNMLSHAGHWVWRCMQVAGVTSWDMLPGKTIRVARLKADGYNATIRGIGHIVEDDWFFPAEDFKTESA